MKTCSKCGLEKPMAKEYFYVRKDMADGFRSECKECIINASSKYYENNREKANIKSKRYYENNREEILKQKQEYGAENKEKISQYKKEEYENNRDSILEARKLYRKANLEMITQRQKKHYQENKKEILARDKIYYKKNREKIILASRQYAKDNPIKKKMIEQKRRARKKLLPYTLTLEQWSNIRQNFDFRCAYCGMVEQEHLEVHNEQLHQEHFIALSKGGGYTRNNIIPSCRSCNISKHNKDFFEWYPRYEYYSKERETFILEYLGYVNKTQQLSIYNG